LGHDLTPAPFPAREGGRILRFAQDKPHP
jgi:hypothetical protein